MAPRKRMIEEITMLPEPALSDAQRGLLCAGIGLFNAGSHWHAHEQWEMLWLMLGPGPDDDYEIVLRGLIQLAAALHLRGIERADGARNNFLKAAEKLALAPERFLGIDIGALRRNIERQCSGLGDEPILIDYSIGLPSVAG